MKWNLKRSLGAAFLLLELGFLVWWLFRLDGQYDNEDFVFFPLLIAVSGFPAGIVGLTLLSLMDAIVPVFAGHTRLAAIAIWLILTAAAYLQWFVWVPMLARRIRGWRERRSQA